MKYAVILAAGSGVRMNSEVPKQFLKLGNKPIYYYSVLEFSRNKNIDSIIVCVPKDYIIKVKQELENLSSKIIVIEGSNTRNNTLFSCIDFIEKKYGINENDIIITHDGARPFVTNDIIDSNIEAVIKTDAVTTAIEATDTIIRSKDSINVYEIPNRSEMYNEQTPQTFNLKKLINNYKKLSKEEIEKLTDATKIFLLAGENVSIVKGNLTNIKITTQQDLDLANILINNKTSNQ